MFTRLQNILGSKPSEADDGPRVLIGYGSTPDFGDDLLTSQMLHLSDFKEIYLNLKNRLYMKVYF